LVKQNYIYYLSMSNIFRALIKQKIEFEYRKNVAKIKLLITIDAVNF